MDKKDFTDELTSGFVGGFRREIMEDYSADIAKITDIVSSSPPTPRDIISHIKTEGNINPLDVDNVNVLFRFLRRSMEGVYFNIQLPDVPLNTLGDALERRKQHLKQALNIYLPNVSDPLQVLAITYLNRYQDIFNMLRLKQTANFADTALAGMNTFTRTCEASIRGSVPLAALVEDRQSISETINRSFGFLIAPLTNTTGVLIAKLLDQITDSNNALKRELIKLVDLDLRGINGPVIVYDAERVLDSLKNSEDTETIQRLIRSKQMQSHGCPFGGNFSRHTWFQLQNDIAKNPHIINDLK